MSTFVKVNVTSLQPGCYVDGSHISALDFNLRVIEVASSYGFSPSVEDAQFIVDAGENPDDADYETSLEIADDAEIWLNEVTDGDYVWHIEEQSLYLSHRSDLTDD